MSGEVEQDVCDFCRQDKPVERTYLRPSKYQKSDNPIVNKDLYNEGSYFIIIRTCFDCGKPKNMNDMNTPEHYDMKIQPIEYIMANGLGFCEGNIVKYVSRYAEKGGLDDLRKAKHYIEILINDWMDSHVDPQARERMKAEQARIDEELEQKKQDKIAVNKEWADIGGA
jgi:hypothetical protein